MTQCPLSKIYDDESRAISDFGTLWSKVTRSEFKQWSNSICSVIASNYHGVYSSRPS